MRVKIPISSGLAILLMGLTGIALAGCLPGLQDKNSRDIERHVPGPGWFEDGWHDPEGLGLIHESSVRSSVDISAAAEALWPVVEGREDQFLIAEDEEPSDYRLDSIIGVWVPASLEGSPSSAFFWNSMEPTDVFVVVMQRLQDGWRTGFAMARGGSQWQYSDSYFASAHDVGEGVALLQAEGVDSSSVRLLNAGNVVCWLMYPAKREGHEAMLLDYVPIRNLYIADQPVRSFESVPWWFVKEPIELRWIK